MDKQISSSEFLVTKALASPEILQALKTKPEETLKNLGNEVAKEFPRAVPLDLRTGNAIWLIVVIAFALVMVGAAYVLGAGITTKLEVNTIYATKGDTILTVFTTAVAFLAGLLSPSPIKK